MSNKLQDIAQITRYIKDQKVKNHVVANWTKVKKISEDREKADKLIDSLLTEKIEEVDKHFNLMRGQA